MNITIKFLTHENGYNSLKEAYIAHEVHVLFTIAHTSSNIIGAPFPCSSARYQRSRRVSRRARHVMSPCWSSLIPATSRTTSRWPYWKPRRSQTQLCRDS